MALPVLLAALALAALPAPDAGPSPGPGEAASPPCRARAQSDVWDRVYCGVVPPPDAAWAPPRDYPDVRGYDEGGARVAPYDYGVVLADGHTALRRPVVFLSGFDPLNSYGLDDLYRASNRGAGLLDSLRRDYDLVFMDYGDSQDFIQRHASALDDLLGRLEAEAGSVEAVVGLSMGGLVARYALARREGEGRAGPRLLLTYDTPHQGAYIPAAIHLLTADLYDQLDGLLAVLAWADDGLGDLADRALFGAAAQQLSLFWVGADVEGGRGAGTPIRRDLYADLRAVGDYPRGLRLAAVSNGSADGRRQHGGAAWAERADELRPGALVAAREVGAFGLWGGLGFRFTFELRRAGGDGPVYTRRLERCYATCLVGPDETIAVTDGGLAPLDVVPGSYESFFRAVDYGDARLRDGWGWLAHLATGVSYYYGGDVHSTRHAHVPTVSALDYDREGHVHDAFARQSFDRPAPDPGRTPFDAVLTATGSGAGENQKHLHVSAEAREFVRAQLAAVAD